MKQFKMIGGTILALLMAGCSDDMIENQGVPPVSGEEIAFGVHSDNFNVPESRTIYEIPEGQTVTNYSRLNIAWVPDRILFVYIVRNLQRVLNGLIMQLKEVKQSHILLKRDIPVYVGEM